MRVSSLARQLFTEWRALAGELSFYPHLRRGVAFANGTGQALRLQPSRLHSIDHKSPLVSEARQFIEKLWLTMYPTRKLRNPLGSSVWFIKNIAAKLPLFFETRQLL